MYYLIILMYNYILGTPSHGIWIGNNMTTQSHNIVTFIKEPDDDNDNLIWIFSLKDMTLYLLVHKCIKEQWK